MLLPWMVFSLLSDGRKVLVARFATKIMATDFVAYQAEVSDELYEVERDPSTFW